MIELHFSFLPQRSINDEWIEKNAHTQWECKIIEKVDASSKLTPFKLYAAKSVDDFYSHITVENIIVTDPDTSAIHIIRNNGVYSTLEAAIEGTETFTKDIKAFIEIWQDNSIKGDYTITL